MERNTEAVAQDCFIKISVPKNVREIHISNVCGKALLKSQRLKEGQRAFPSELSENLQSNIDLIKSLSKERSFHQVDAEKLKRTLLFAEF